MSERDPHKSYPHQVVGEHPGRFEVEAQVWHEPPKQLGQYLSLPVPSASSGRVTVEATKPDARIALRLTIGFAPEPRPGIDDDSLDFVCFDGLTVRQHLALTKVWLSLCDEYGAGFREAEDAIGTEAAPVQMIEDGLWAAVYEVDLDCKAVRARVDLASPGIPGRFYAKTKWVAVAPVSDRDWFEARQRMQLLVGPKLPTLDVGGRRMV